MAHERDGAFKCVKISLIVIYSIAVFVAGIAFIIFAVLLASVQNSDQTQEQKDDLSESYWLSYIQNILQSIFWKMFTLLQPPILMKFGILMYFGS